MPLPVKTALAQVTGAKPSPREAYEGGFHHTGEAAELEWARFFPDFAALADDGRFAAWADTLYAPLAAWGAQSVDIVAWEQLDAALLAAPTEAPHA